MQVPDDSKGACAFQMLQYVKLQVNPQIIVLPATAESELLAAARAPAAAAAGAAALAGEGAEADAEVVVQLQRPSMFTYDRVSAAYAGSSADVPARREEMQMWWCSYSAPASSLTTG
jgi:hypothetical protein